MDSKGGGGPTLTGRKLEMTWVSSAVVLGSVRAMLSEGAPLGGGGGSNSIGVEAMFDGPLSWKGRNGQVRRL